MEPVPDKIIAMRASGTSTPSLRTWEVTRISVIYPKAVKRVRQKSQLPAAIFAESCPYSPEQIAGRLKKAGQESLSHETIYQMIYQNYP